MELLTIWLSPLFTDRCYIRLLSKIRCGYVFDLKHPRTFNEKLNWIKINNRNPLYTRMADKYQAKEYARECIGDEYIVPLYGVWDRVEDIDFSALPVPCMLKSNADSCGRIVYRGGQMNASSIKKKLESQYPFNYYWQSREWPYKNIKRKIIAEQFLDNGGEIITDYKFWCFGGEPKIVYMTCKEGKVFENFYDMDFQPVSIDHGFPRRVPEFEKPAQFEMMKELAAKLSQGIPFVRVDFMMVQGRIWFGECTFFDWGGFQPFGGDWDEKLGAWIKLPIE